MQLRCLAVGKHSRFFVGDICDVANINSDDEMKTGIITILSEEVKAVTPFRLSNAKNLITKTEAFRIRCTPTEAVT